VNNPTLQTGRSTQVRLIDPERLQGEARRAAFAAVLIVILIAALLLADHWLHFIHWDDR
jgi:hypothetical protein